MKQMSKLRERLRIIFNSIIGDEKYAKNLEIGIYNYTIKQGRIKKIVRKWTNADFRNIYINRFRTIYNNINPTGLVFEKKFCSSAVRLSPEHPKITGLA